MAKLLYVRDPNGKTPVASPGYVFDQNRIWIDADNTHRKNALAAMGCELITEDDSRYAFVVAQGWSRQAARRYAIENPPQNTQEN